LTEYLLGRAVGIHVCGVDEVDARFEGEVDQPTCLLDVGIAPSSEELTFSCECRCAQAQFRHHQAGVADASILHDSSLIGIMSR